MSSCFPYRLVTDGVRRIKQFREAFTLIDTDGDGKISEADLIATFGNLGTPSASFLAAIANASLGQTPNRQLLESLLTQPGGSASRSINFTQFLTLFGQHLLALADSEQEILDAFACFDEHDEGVVDVQGAGGEMIGQEGLRGWLRDVGDKMSEAEVSRRCYKSQSVCSYFVSWIASSRALSRIGRASLIMSSLQRR